MKAQTALITIFLAALWLLLITGSALPQNEETLRDRALRRKKIQIPPKAEQIAEKEENQIISGMKRSALESYIDPDSYRLGPGDQLLISIWGQINESFPTFVSPEGYILVPSVKEIDVRNMALAAAKTRIINEMKSYYQRADITVSLLSVRSFRVHVTGYTNTTGSFVVSAVDRVSDAIALAGGILDSNLSSQRNIVIYRKPSSILYADLIKQSRTGDLQYDPVLMDGDVIYVPPIYSYIYIYNGVHMPGRYEFVRNETLHDFIRIAGGLKYGVDSSLIEISRFTSDTGQVTQKLSIDYRTVIQNLADTSINIILRPNDRIVVKLIPRFQIKNNITIRGEVNYPGTYPIEEGKTKFTDIIKMAGGFTIDASMQNIVIYRDIRYEGRDLEYERLAQTPVMDMNDIEKAYFKAKSRQYYPTVQTDFDKLFSGNTIDPQYDILLKDGDIIEVGKKKKTVRVLGGVISPGIYDIISEKDFNFYIQKAGGFSVRADKGEVRIIRPSSQSWLKADRKIRIDDGDVIFIPEKEPVDGWKIFRETVAMIGQLAAITATIILIYKTR